jgi:hypothetical protein
MVKARRGSWKDRSLFFGATGLHKLTVYLAA